MNDRSSYYAVLILYIIVFTNHKSRNMELSMAWVVKMVGEIGIIRIFFPIKENCEVIYMYTLRYISYVSVLSYYFNISVSIQKLVADFH